jgi:chromosomal replication initiation ATPase DnaA
MSDQPRLFEFSMGERSPDTLVVADANRDAARLLTDWRAWPGGALALIGPKGSGKTHLALAWALEAGARQLCAGHSRRRCR